MIASITTKGFKGRDGTAELGPRTLVIGPNGSGKSTISQALQFVALGFVPGAGKRPADILDAFGDGKSMSATLTLDNGRTLGRGLTRKEAGTVSSSYKVGERGTAKKADFDAALGKADIRVVDLAAFLALSSQAQQEKIFFLFPPAGDLGGLGQKIEDATKQINSLEAKHKDALGLAAKNRTTRAGMALPGRTLAEVQADIEARAGELEQAQKDVTLAEDAAARAAEAEKQAAEATARAAEAKKVDVPMHIPGAAEDLAAGVISPGPAPTTFPADPAQARAVEKNLEWARPSGLRNIADPAPPEQPSRDLAAPYVDQVRHPQDDLGWKPYAEMVSRHQAITSILSILSTLDRAGCTACAARLVALRELKKFAPDVQVTKETPAKEAANA